MEEADANGNEDVDKCDIANVGTGATAGVDAEAGAAEAIVAAEVAAA